MAYIIILLLSKQDMLILLLSVDPCAMTCSMVRPLV